LAGLSLSGCFLINFAPSVSLSTESTTVAAGTEVTVTASCYDLNGDSLSYSWKLEGVSQSGEKESTFTFSEYPLEDTEYDVTVKVNDGENTVSASIAITVQGQTVAESGYAGTTPWVSGSYSGGLTYTLDVGSTAKDVYFVFTNTSLTAADANPTVEPKSSVRTTSRTLSPLSGAAKGLAIRGRPDISEFNRTSYARNRSGVAAKKGIRGVARSITAGSSTDTFHDYNNNTSVYFDVPATCRAAVTRSSTATGYPRTLYIWVANDCWSGDAAATGKSYYVDQDKVDALADRFLSSSGDRIYDWVTNIYGEEWASTGEGVTLDDSLIPADNGIHVLLTDIDQDDLSSTTGYTVGYFWSKDNYTTTAYSKSNARVMFYIDAVLFADPNQSDDTPVTTWTMDNYWPGEIVSTLAHEFQHMIEFYQKSVLKKTDGEDTWLNEMSSQVTEDLVAEKLGVLGPRGVAATDGTAGSADNFEGRIPLYNAAGYMRLVEWTNDSYVLVNYSNVYAFGAYLARNYGGAALLRSIQHNAYTDTQAVTQAVSDVMSLSVTFTELVRRWGAAVLLSDIQGPMTYYTYNTGAWNSAALGSFTYRLGSINVHNYNYTYSDGSVQDGPLVFDGSMSFSDGTTGIPGSTLMPVGGACNVFYRAGDGVTGSNSWAVDMPEDFIMTVVVK